MVPMSAFPPGIPLTDQMTGASVLNCIVWVTRRLLPVAWMADIFSIAAWLRLKTQPAVMPLMTVRERAAALRCQFVDKLAVDILRSVLDRTKSGRLTAEKRDVRRSGSLKVPKPGTQGNGTFEVLNVYGCNTDQATARLVLRVRGRAGHYFGGESKLSPLN